MHVQSGIHLNHGRKQGTTKTISELHYVDNFRIALCRHSTTLKLFSQFIASASRFNVEVSVGSTWIKSSLEVQAAIVVSQTLAVNFHLVLKYITKHIQSGIHLEFRREQRTSKSISELHYVDILQLWNYFQRRHSATLKFIFKLFSLFLSPASRCNLETNVDSSLVWRSKQRSMPCRRLL